MPPSRSTEPHVPEVLIAGGGVAALEAALALRTTSTPATLGITMLAPDRSVRYPPLSVLEPFAAVPEAGSLAAFAADVGARLVPGSLAAVDVDARTAWTHDGATLEYDALLVAIGARAEVAVRGAIPFRGAQDAEAVRAAVDDLRGGGMLAFVVPASVSWSLPAYELALLAAARLGGGSGPAVRVVTAEQAPLQAFGADGSAVVAGKLDEHGIVLHCDAAVDRLSPGSILLQDGRRLAAERVVALPVAVGRPVAGIGGADGFLTTDEDGRVRACPHVYAAGDATARPYKQGGLACQQADAAAAAIAADLGVPAPPAPYRPVLRGVLVSADAPAYLRRALDERIDAPGEALLNARATGPWPGGKVVGRHLGPYLARRAWGPGGPEAPLRLPG